MKYNKLVRDKIPERLKGKGLTPIIHIADNKEYKEKLRKKLVEESREYYKSGKVEELADILEVIYTTCELKGIGIKDLEDIRMKKRVERGGFEEKIILDEVKE